MEKKPARRTPSPAEVVAYDCETHPEDPLVGSQGRSVRLPHHPWCRGADHSLAIMGQVVEHVSNTLRFVTVPAHVRVNLYSALNQPNQQHSTLLKVGAVDSSLAHSFQRWQGQAPLVPLWR